MSYDTELCTGGRHAVRPLTTQRHHIHPKYLAALLHLPVEDHLIAPVCGACHDAIHHLIEHLINTGETKGHRRGARYWVFVDAAWTWWKANVVA